MSSDSPVVVDLKLKQSFVPENLKKVASAFKTTLRNTTYNVDDYRGGLPAPAPAPFVHRRMHFEQSSGHKAIQRGNGCAFVFDPSSTLCPSAEAIISRICPPCTGCGEFKTATPPKYVRCDLLPYPWLPFCDKCAKDVK